MKKASVTVFMGMSLMMILSVFFSLLEVLHYYSMKKEAIIVTDIGIESMFADYNRPMWEEYGILGMDLGYCSSQMNPAKATERIEGYMRANLSAPDIPIGGNHLSMDVSKCAITEYDLITDYDGKLFIKLCAKSALYGIPDDVLEALKENTADIKEADKSDIDIDVMLESGKTAIEDGSSEDYEDEDLNTKKPSDVEGGLSDEEIDKAGNPIDDISEFREGGILEQVIPEGKSVSEKTINTDNQLSERKLSEGTNKSEVSNDVKDNLLYEYYLLDRFSCFSDDKSRDGALYELEYIVNGKSSDKENLKKTVEKILLLREAANIAAITADPKKLAQTESLAISLAGVSVNPLIIEAVQGGIIAAWAYVESILDLRTLIDGGRIAVIKSPADWTSNLTGLATCLNRQAKAKESKEGISYKGYLGGMVLLINNKKSSFRAMELIENELRSKEDYKDIRLDNMIVTAKLETSFEAAPIFGSLVRYGNSPGRFEFNDEEVLSYTD